VIPMIDVGTQNWCLNGVCSLRSESPMKRGSGVSHPLFIEYTHRNEIFFFFLWYI